jgi:hypothetical protein
MSSPDVQQLRAALDEAAMPSRGQSVWPHSFDATPRAWRTMPCSSKPPSGGRLCPSQRAATTTGREVMRAAIYDLMKL